MDLSKLRHRARSALFRTCGFAARNYLVSIAASVLLLAAVAAVVAIARPNNHRRLRLRAGEVVDLTQEPKYRTDRVLVRFRSGTTLASMSVAHAVVQGEVAREFRSVPRLQVVHLGGGVSVQAALRMYRQNPAVLYAEPDYIVKIDTTPNDPQFTSQWNLHNTGQNSGTPGADIHAPEAWDITTGSSNVVVGVIDTGADYTHPDLAANIWTSTSSLSVTTSSGSTLQCPSGIHGINVIAQTCDPMDDNAHGTHVSGIIGALGNNGIGAAGINWNVQILPCKFLGPDGTGDVGGAVTCFDFMKQLKDNGVDVVATNNSWGGALSSQALQDAIAAQEQDGILTIGAAGNNFSDNDLLPFYPASISLPNVISVAASDRNDSLVSFSNTGRYTVHLAAPGEEILSTTPNDTYSVFSGTSMAAPHVTGVAALLKAQDPTRDWRAIKNLILAGGDALAVAGDTITSKRLNAFGAVSCTNSQVTSRLLPVPGTISGAVGAPIVLSALNINCANAAGNVSVQVSPGGQVITLTDDGTGADQVAGDGIYTAEWSPAATGDYTLSFPDGSSVNVAVLNPYGYQEVPSSYQTITGTNLNLGDDSIANLPSPFPIQFGGGSFNQLFISSNGTISFTDAYYDLPGFQVDFLSPLTFSQQPTTLVAPFWQDLYPVKGSAQNVYWAVTGSAPNRNLVVEWRNVRSFACRADNAATVTFEAVFSEANSTVQFNYARTTFGDACSYQDYGQAATVGIATATSNFVAYSHPRELDLPNNTSLLWQSPPQTAGNNPAPAITTISPNAALLFGPDLTLTVNGSGFLLGSLIQWNGTSMPTTFVSNTQLTAVLPAELFAPFNVYGAPGTPPQVTVFNPPPGGGSSNAIAFTIARGAPTITSITPSSVSAGGMSFVLAIQGTNLYGASFYWNGNLQQTTSLDNNLAGIDVPYSLIANPGTAVITATVAPPGGGTSNAVTLTINPTPTAQNAKLAATRENKLVSSAAKAPPDLGPLHPMRFLGWNYGRTAGANYLKFFSRPYGGVPLPAPQSTIVSRTDSAWRIPSSEAATQTSLSQPASLPGFDFHPNLPAGFIPTAVVAGDFNRDGKMDWAVSNGGSNDVWIYFGNGDGTSQLPTIIRLSGAAPLGLVSADLRKNGISDLIVAEADSQTIGVLLGNGDGTFAPEVEYFVPAPPLSLDVADLNGDGNLDIVAGLLGDQNTGPLATLLGDGTGKFGAPLSRPVDLVTGSYATTTVLAKDLNGDGIPDLVVIDNGGVVPGAHSYLGRGDGTFKHAEYFFEDGGFEIPDDVTNVALGDMDGDGCVDAVTTETYGNVRIFKGSCDGSFVGFPNVTTVGAGDAGATIALADLDGDGHLDVLTTGLFLGVGPPFGQEATNLVSVLRGDGHGNLSVPKVYRNEPDCFGLAIADLNGDGKPDAITACQDTDTAAVFVNDGTGSFAAPYGGYIGYIENGQGGSINAPFTDFYFADLNGDGKPDLALVDQQQYFYYPWEFTVLLNDGANHFGPAIQSPMADGSGYLTGHLLGDFRNTGLPDLLAYECSAGCESNPAIVFSSNNGNGQFGPPKTTQLDVNTFGSLGAIAAGDFNKDGKLDFVVAAGLPGNSPLVSSGFLGLTVFLGNGDGTFRQQPTIPYAQSVAGGTTFPLLFVNDFNRDGNLDVLVWYANNVVGISTNDVYEFLGKGDGTFAAPNPVLPNFYNFGMADLNHDGLPDIVEYSTQPVEGGFIVPESYSIYLGQPDGSFKFSQTYASYSNSFLTDYLFDNGRPSQRQSPMLADFNGDGNIDIASFQFTGFFPNPETYMQVLAGNGDGTFTPTYTTINFDKRGFPSSAFDINGDGRADLIEVDGWSSSYHIIPGIPGPTVQLQLASQPIVGANGTLIVNLALPATSGTIVQLSASDPNISLPASITVPLGNLSVNVPFTIGQSFNSSHVFALNATLSGQTATVYSYQTTAALAGFKLSSFSQNEVAPPMGTTPDYNVVVFSMGGYSTNSVQFSCQGLPAGASCQFGQTSLALPRGQSIGNSLKIQLSTNIPLGAYPFQVVAADGSVTDQLPLKLIVADFSLSASPTSLNAVEGTTANISLTIQGTAGWTQLVNTTCMVSPQGPSGPFCLGGGGGFFAGTYPVTISTANVAPADFTIQFSGSAEGVTHQAAPVILHIQNAVGTLSPTSAQIPVGSSAPFNISVTSQNGLTDQFTFSCPGLPSGISCSFNPPSGVLSPNGTLTTALTVSVVSRPAAFYVLPLNVWPPLRILLFLLKGTALVLVFLLLCHAYYGMRPATRPYASAAFPALFLAAVLFAAVSCGGGGAGSPPPSPPTVSLQANPASISAGGSATLTWNSTNATQLSISPGVGSVGPQGSTTIQPTSSTTYTISASGPGGSTSASASVTVKSAQTVMVTVQAASPSVTVTPGSIAVSIP
jgi:subtilisin family serine protease